MTAKIHTKLQIAICLELCFYNFHFNITENLQLKKILNSSSLQWLSLKMENNGSYIISIDNDKTKQFQNTFVEKEDWKKYIPLFRIYQMETVFDSKFYFDFFEMKWHKSLKVL